MADTVVAELQVVVELPVAVELPVLAAAAADHYYCCTMQRHQGVVDVGKS